MYWRAGNKTTVQKIKRVPKKWSVKIANAHSRLTDELVHFSCSFLPTFESQTPPDSKPLLMRCSFLTQFFARNQPVLEIMQNSFLITQALCPKHRFVVYFLAA